MRNSPLKKIMLGVVVACAVLLGNYKLAFASSDLMPMRMSLVVVHQLLGITFHVWVPVAPGLVDITIGVPVCVPTLAIVMLEFVQAFLT